MTVEDELAGALNPEVDPTISRTRWGVVDSIQNDGETATVRIGGSSVQIPGVRTLVPVCAGMVVTLNRVDADLFIVGALDTGWESIASLGFANSWVAYDAVNYPAKYRRASGIVYLRGLISGGTVGNAAAFTLPVGFRPTTTGQLIFPTASNDAFGEIRVNTDGSVRCWIGNNAWFSLNSVIFPVEQ